MGTRRHPATRRRVNRGFTLVEMSVVLVIVGLLIMTVFPALTALRASSQSAATQSNLRALMLATAAFVQANGCVPCPTPAATVGAGFGRVRGDTAALMCNGCATAEGIPPFVSLGLPARVAHDGWGHWVTMRVDPALTAKSLGLVVPPTAACSGAANCPMSNQGLCQAGLANTGNRVNVQTPSGAAQAAAVVLVSHGSKGYGAFYASAAPYDDGYNNNCRIDFPTAGVACRQALTCAAPQSGLDFAMCNANGNNQFYDAPGQDNYDDVMLFADRNTLVSMLGSGACQTVW